MRALKLIASAAALFIVLPVFIVGVLGLLFSPLQTTARATEPCPALEARDLMLSDAVKEQVRLAEGGASSDDVGVSEPLAQDAIPSDSDPQRFECQEYACQDYGYQDADCQSSNYQGVEYQDCGYQDLSSQDLSSQDSSTQDSFIQDSSTQYSFTEDSTAETPLLEEHASSGALLQDDSGGDLLQEPEVQQDASRESSQDRYSSEQLRVLGVVDDGTYQYTWYSQRVLPGDGLQIDGRHVSGEGYVVDAQERIVVASSDLPYGTEVDVPFGSGKAVVLDTGCASGVLDIYTDFM